MAVYQRSEERAKSSSKNSRCIFVIEIPFYSAIWYLLSAVVVVKRKKKEEVIIISSSIFVVNRLKVAIRLIKFILNNS